MGLLEALKSIDLSRKIALGEEPPSGSKGEFKRLVLTRIEWIKEKDNKERLKQEAVSVSNRRNEKEDQKRNNALKSKYRGVRLRAESGGVEAMFELSELLRNGIGCETNINESNQWLSKFNQKRQSEIK